jgi:hypothetical protein
MWIGGGRKALKTKSGRSSSSSKFSSFKQSISRVKQTYCKVRPQGKLQVGLYSRLFHLSSCCSKLAH